MVDSVPPSRTTRPAVPAAVESALLRALAKAPGDRYATMLEFAQALGGSSVDSGAVATAVVRPAVAPRGRGPPSLPVLLEADVSSGRYRLLHRIGAGGMGEVWKAHDANLDRVVAIKLVQGKLGDPTTHARFRREAHALSRLSHPGVATIFDFDVQDGVDYLVMEFVPGGTLEARIAQGPLEFEDLLRLGAAIADALHEAHQHGILHRDLKPGNVVLSEGGLPKILDFGIARLMGGDGGAAPLTETGLIVGSLPYMAPEQLMGEADDARSDIYALGVMLFEMATGRLPFVKTRREALMFEILSNAAPPCPHPPARRAGCARSAGCRLPEQGFGAAPGVRRPRRRRVALHCQRHADGHRGHCSARRHSRHRGAAAAERLQRPGARILRGRHDRGDHL
jgi:serine/threonine protein kinase